MTTQVAQLPKRASELDGLTKAAVLLLSLDSDNATQLLRTMAPEMVEDLTRKLAQLDEIPADLNAQVVAEFYSMSISGGRVREGGLETARTMLRNSLEPTQADQVIKQIQSQVQRSPFAFLQKAQSDNLLAFIQDEHPQTIALILSHMPNHKASEILSGLAPEKQVEVVRRMANMEQTNPAVIREVEKGLESRVSNLLQHATEKVGGVQTVAEMLNLCDRATEKSILEGIEAGDPELVSEIRRLMFVFEDILLVNDKGIQSVLKEVDNDELCLALKTASDELKDKIFSNMSQRAAELVKEDMEYMGPVRLSDVENAQQRIVDVVRRLEDAGEIFVSGRGGEGDLVV